MDSNNQNEELTSTMGNLIPTRDDSGDISDLTPTSSTDATAGTAIAPIDDPISSTSSETNEASIEAKLPSSGEPVVSAKDLLDMNITDTCSEKITENVDDIAQDLENLLGESSSSLDFTIKSGKLSENKEENLDLDALSMELATENKNVEPVVEAVAEETKQLEVGAGENVANDQIEESLDKADDKLSLFEETKENEDVEPVKEAEPIEQVENALEIAKESLAEPQTEDLEVETPKEDLEIEEEAQESIIEAKIEEGAQIPAEKNEPGEANEIPNESPIETADQAENLQLQLQNMEESINSEEPEHQNATIDAFKPKPEVAQDQPAENPQLSANTLSTSSLLSFHSSDNAILSAVSSIGGGEEHIPIETESETPQTIENQPLDEIPDELLPKENKLEPLVINVGDMEKDRPYSSKITIKGLRQQETQENEEKEQKGSLKMTITKQANTMHSILKIYNPEDDSTPQQNVEEGEQTVPKLIIKPMLSSGDSPHSPKRSKVYSPSGARSASPRITIKPLKPPENVEAISPLKITIKPVLKAEERQKHSPKLTIKPIVKPSEEEEAKVHSPRVTIKPIVKPVDEIEQQSSPRITIKPIMKASEVEKPISPKITIKPIIKPGESEEEDPGKERIVLKINKGNIKPQEEEKLAKIKLKFSKEGGHAHIVQEDEEEPPLKKQRTEPETLPSSPTHSKLKEMLCAATFSKRDYSLPEKMAVEEDDDGCVVEAAAEKMSPIVISEESTQEMQSTATFELKTEEAPPAPPEVPIAPAPRKRGRPRKVPLEVREDFKEETKAPIVVESTRPKRSCRGPSVRTTLGMKPRKPRGPGRGRGGKRGMGSRGSGRPKEPRLSAAKLRQQVKDELLALNRLDSIRDFEDGFMKSSIPAESTTDSADIVMYEEETRMSADTSSRAHTPAKQVVTIPTVDLVDESQSSIQSTATTESTSKSRRGPRLEVQEPEGAVISADQLAEYYWSGGGPYMLQEQVAQFLGIKSFKRKYPNIPRRVVDMQERDFIRESGLAGESMCDLGLTAVNSTDILDIMYSDFQDKYEEYCKHQRDRQAKDMTNKQKALSLAASQEKTKMDITQQAVQSSANWNFKFNKARKEGRKACMDLQTLTIHYPRGKVKQLNKPKVGFYPVALVPGQFIDYYRELVPQELSSLPLNTISLHTVTKREVECDSQTDGSGSESESSSSDSESSFSGSSDDDCTLCKPTTPKRMATVV